MSEKIEYLKAKVRAVPAKVEDWFLVIKCTFVYCKTCLKDLVKNAMQKLEFDAAQRIIKDCAKEPICIKQGSCDIIQDCHGKGNSAELSAQVNGMLPDYPYERLPVKVRLRLNYYDLVSIIIGIILIVFIINMLKTDFIYLFILVFAPFLPCFNCLTRANLYFVDAGSPLPKNVSLKDKDSLHLAIRITHKRIQNIPKNIPNGKKFTLDWFNKKSPTSLKHKAILTIMYLLLQKNGHIPIINIFLKFARGHVFLFLLLTFSPFLVDWGQKVCNIHINLKYLFGFLGGSWFFYYIFFYPRMIKWLLDSFEVMERYDPWKSAPVSYWDFKNKEWKEISFEETCEAKNLMVKYMLDNDKLTNIVIGLFLTFYIALLQLL